MILDEGKFKNKMVGHFKNLNKPRHPQQKDRDAWMAGRQYVMEAFRDAGLTPELQCFNTSVKVGRGYEETEEVTGCNIVGHIKGEDDRNHVIVGANYDTSVSSSNMRPLRRNGVGVATLIEVARAVELSASWRLHKPKHTTTFVAFDLNTLEESTRQSSKPGSQFFVEEFVDKRDSIRGAFILSSIGSYNNEPQSQSLPADFDEVFEKEYKEISEEQNRRGNFLAAVSKTNAMDLQSKFKDNYKKHGDKDYRLQTMMANDFGIAKTYQMLEEFDAHAFWTSKAGVPTILLTDTTEDYRHLSDKCSYNCDLDSFGNPKRMAFLYSTYEALSQTLLDEQTRHVKPVSGGCSLSPSGIISTVVAADRKSVV